VKQLKEIKLPVQNKQTQIDIPDITKEKGYKNWCIKLSDKTPIQTDKELYKELCDVLGDNQIEKQIIPDYNSPYGFDYRIKEYRIKSKDKEKLIEAFKLVQYSLAPLPYEELKKHLTVMYAMQVQTGGQRMTAKEKAQQMAVMLKNTPADITTYAIRYLTNEGKFWSSWAEFNKLIGQRLIKRTLLLEALRKKINSLNIIDK
jgi:hypothetical protein